MRVAREIAWNELIECSGEYVREFRCQIRKCSFLKKLYLVFCTDGFCVASD
jgi:hypothetical protein